MSEGGLQDVPTGILVDVELDKTLHLDLTLVQKSVQI